MALAGSRKSMFLSRLTHLPSQSTYLATHPQLLHSLTNLSPQHQLYNLAAQAAMALAGSRKSMFLPPCDSCLRFPQAAIALAGSRKSMSDGLGALPSQMPSSAPKLSFDNGGFCVTNPAAPILPPGPSSSIPAPPLRIGLPPMPGSNAHRQQQQQLNKAPSAKGESRLELSLQSLADPNRRPMPPPSTTTQPRVSPSASAPNLGEGGPAERRSSGGGGASTSRNIPPPRGEAAAQGGGHLDTLQVAPRSLNMPSFVGRSASASGGGSGKGNEMGAAVASATPAVEGTAGSGSGGPNPAAGASHPGKAGGSRTSHGDPAELSGENPDKFAEGVAAGADEEGADEVPAEGDGSGRGEGSQKSSAQEAGSKPDESDPYHMNLHLEINQLISKNNLVGNKLSISTS
eukprot:gene15215-21293_t